MISGPIQSCSIISNLTRHRLCSIVGMYINYNPCSTLYCSKISCTMLALFMSSLHIDHRALSQNQYQKSHYPTTHPEWTREIKICNIPTRQLMVWCCKSWVISSRELCQLCPELVQFYYNESTRVYFMFSFRFSIAFVYGILKKSLIVCNNELKIISFSSKHDKCSHYLQMFYLFCLS
jgi:hypothetical protein